MNNDGKMRITIDIEKCDSIRCQMCGGEIFTTGVVIKRIPALLSPTGREELVSVPVLICKDCGSALRSMENIQPCKQ